jgi:adenylate cyclase
VGAWARGLGDNHQVAAGQSLKGLEVHATIIENILSGTFISCPDWARGAELFAILLLGILSTWLISQPGFLLALLTTAVSTGGCYLAARELLLSMGVYLSPLLPMVTPIIVLTFLSLMKYGIEARKVLQRNRDLVEAQDAIISSLSALAETRDKETGGHIQRTKYYVETLARQLATFPQYRDLDEITIDLLAKSAQLHDIGKVGIPDYILLKPDALTEEEFGIMKTHTLIGARSIIKAIDGNAHPEGLDFLHVALQMVESHHEKWYGCGYPNGLSGTDIPLPGRLMALADAYDAIVSKRIYKRVFSHTEAKDLILKDSGSHFDPDVVAAFVAKSEEFIIISRKFTDA